MLDNNIVSSIKCLDIAVTKKIMKGKDIKHHPSPTQIRIIKYMFDHQQEDIYQKTIENYLKSSRSTVSDVLKTMEKNGYIKKISDATDARINKIVLNKKTLDMHKNLIEEINNLNKIIKKDIKKEDLNTFMKVITKMQENLK